jgi:hypothetical protein
MLLYVYVAYPGNAAAKSWLAAGCSRQPGYPWEASNRTRASNRVCLLLVPQWPQMVNILVTR